VLAGQFLPSAPDGKPQRSIAAMLLALVALCLGILIWLLLCKLILNEWLVVIRTWAWPVNSRDTTGHGPIYYYISQWPRYCGPVFFLPFVAGVIPSLRRGMALPWTLWLLFIGLHSFLYWRGHFGSLGILRWLAPTAPFTALICLNGVNFIGRGLARLRIGPRGRWAIAAVAVTLGMQWAMLYYAAGPDRYRGFLARRCANYILKEHLLAARSPFVTSDRILIPLLNLPIDADVKDLAWDHDGQIECLRALPLGIVGVWDNEQGVYWHHFDIDDLPAQGFTILHEASGRVPNWFYLTWKNERFVVIRKDRQP
jgi:hypothetical protein